LRLNAVEGGVENQGPVGRAVSVVSRRLLLFFTPIAAAGLAFRGLLWVLHRVLHGVAYGFAFLSVEFGCIFLALFAEAMVSVMYLRLLRGEEAGLRQGFEVGGYRVRWGPWRGLRRSVCFGWCPWWWWE
jgi:hypothetical protein